MEKRFLTVRLNDSEKPGQSKLVEAEWVGESATTVRVKLPDGNIITRKKKRDVPPLASNAVA